MLCPYRNASFDARTNGRILLLLTVLGSLATAALATRVASPLYLLWGMIFPLAAFFLFHLARFPLPRVWVFPRALRWVVACFWTSALILQFERFAA